MSIGFIILLFLTALGFGLLANPLAMRLAPRFGFMDRPGHRKIHKKATPKLGGAAVLASILFAVIAGLVLGGEALDALAQKKILFILGATLAAAILGLLDDTHDLKPKVKFFWQFLIAVAFSYFGFHFEFFHLPGFPIIVLGWLAVPITAIWIVAVLNGFNFMDGVDGLAASVTAVSLAGLGFMSHTIDAKAIEYLWPAGLGAVAAFLIFNWRPAKIYLGDSGACSLGMFTAACLVALGIGNNPTTVTAKYWDVELRFHLVAATLLVGYPLLEVFLSTIRRGVRKLTTGRSMEWSEKEHIHHRLLKLGISASTISVVAILFEILVVIAAIFLMAKEGARATMTLLPILVVMSYIMPRLGFFDFLDPKIIQYTKPHYQIAHSFMTMQGAKLGLIQNRNEVILLVNQACLEFGVQNYQFFVPKDKNGRGGFDYRQELPREDPQQRIFTIAQQGQNSANLSDQYEIPDRNAKAKWTFLPHSEEELDVEYQVLMNNFMRSALESLVRLGKGQPSRKATQAAEFVPLSGYALHKRSKQKRLLKLKDKPSR
jgi:UDP-GlcNAc:undecaprenyl-phosphate GlcNAc-1-phosphate transferase